MHIHCSTFNTVSTVFISKPSIAAVFLLLMTNYKESRLQWSDVHTEFLCVKY
jgi:hypothetical protein